MLASDVSRYVTGLFQLPILLIFFCITNVLILLNIPYCYGRNLLKKGNMLYESKRKFTVEESEISAYSIYFYLYKLCLL